MNKVLFIVKGYYEGSNPNAICSCRIADELSQNGIEVYYLSVEDKTPSTYNPKACHILFGGKRNAMFKKILLYPLDDSELSNMICQAAISMIDKNDIDTVVSFVRPYAAGDALKKIKHKRRSIKAVLFEIDSASNRFKHPKAVGEYLANVKSLIWEAKLYKKVDLIINMNTHKKHYENKIFHAFREKMKYVGVPCMQDLTQICGKSINAQSEEKCFVYFGTFYSKLREPYIMLETLDMVFKRRKISLTIYGSNKNRPFYEKEVFHRNYIFIEGNVDHSTLLQNLGSFDVLLSIGNKDSDFLPSKTVECICSGKKVIHFYSSEDDPSLLYFNQYPNSLLLSEQEKPEKNADRIIEFLKTPLIPIKYSELEEKFYDTTPAYSAETIISVSSPKIDQ